MCDICDGATHDHIQADIRSHIRQVGWAIQGVEPSPGRPGWSYTIGLLSSYDHPELLVVDDDLSRGCAILHAMGRAVRDGAVIEPGDGFDLGGCRAGLVDIHPDHLGGDVLASWHAVFGGPEGPSLELEAHQVIAHDPLPGGDRLPRIRLDVAAAEPGRGALAPAPTPSRRPRPAPTQPTAAPSTPPSPW